MLLVVFGSIYLACSVLLLCTLMKARASAPPSVRAFEANEQMRALQRGPAPRGSLVFSTQP